MDLSKIGSYVSARINKFKNDVAQRANVGISNFQGNVQAIANPATRSTWFTGAASPIVNPITQSKPFQNLSQNWNILTGNGVSANAQKAFQVGMQQPDVGQSRIVQPIRQFTSNYVIPFTSGIQDLRVGQETVYKPGVFNKVKGTAQYVRGIGKALLPINPAYQLANAFSSGTPMTKSNLVGRIGSGIMQGASGVETVGGNVKPQNMSFKAPVIGRVELDPVMAAGSMYGFTKNPVNKTFFKITNKLLPTEKLPIRQFIAVTAARGGLENLGLKLADIPDNASPLEKATFLAKETGFGAISELAVALGIKGANKGLSKFDDQLKITKSLAEVLDSIKKWNNEGEMVKVGTGFDGATTQFKKVSRLTKIALDIKNALTNEEGFVNLGENIGNAAKEEEPKVTTLKAKNYTPLEPEFGAKPQEPWKTPEFKQGFEEQNNKGQGLGDEFEQWMKEQELLPEENKQPMGKFRGDVPEEILSEQGVTPQQLKSNKKAFSNGVFNTQGVERPKGSGEKVNILDYLRTPKKVLEKLGLGNEYAGLERGWENYKTDLRNEVDRLISWKNELSDPNSPRKIFRFLDGQKTDADGTNLVLTTQEQEMAGRIKTFLKEWADKLGLPEDKRISNYITHIFNPSKGAPISPDLAGALTDKVPGSVYDPFLSERLGKQGYVEDVWRALDAYVKRATRKVNMDPALESLQKASKSLEKTSYNYVKEFGARVNMRPTEIDSLIDNFIRATPIGNSLTDRPVNRITSNIRQMIGRAALGLNPVSALKNLTQGVNTYAVLGEKHTAIGYFKLFKDMASGNLDELYQNHILDDNIITDRRFNVNKSAMEKLDKVLFFMFDLAEKINRGSAYFGAKSKALSEGMSEPQAIQFAKDLVAKTQFKYGSMDTPLALSSDISKTLTQFMSFDFKQSEFLADLVKNKNLAGMLRYIGATLVLTNTVGKLFGMKPEYMLPFAGQLLYAKDLVTGQTEQNNTRFPIPPTIQLAGNAAQLPKLLSSDADTKQQGMDAALNLGALTVPAGVQLKRTIQGLQGVAQGASFSKSGKKQYDIPQDLPTTLRAGIFGKNNLPQAQEYFTKVTNYYNAKNGAVNSLKGSDQDALNYYNTLGSDPKAKVLKDSILYNYPNVYLALRNQALELQKTNGQPIDPLFTSPAAMDYLKYQQMQQTAYGSEEGKQFFKNHPEIAQLMQERTAFFDQNPIDGGTEYNAPQPSARVQQLLSTGSKEAYNDPEVIDYLEKRLVYVNKRRAEQGLEPMDKYGNILGSKNYGKEFSSSGRSFYTPKISARKVSKAKIPTPKKLAIKKLKVNKATIKAANPPKVKALSKSKSQPKFKLAKIKKPTFKLKSLI